MGYFSDLDCENLDGFQRQLADAGITREQFDLGNYAGLTYRQLRGVVNDVIKKARESRKNAPS